MAQLCECRDIVCLQGHCLLPSPLNILSQINADVLSRATSAVDFDNVLIGRPYAGTGILYKRNLAQAIGVAETKEPRMTSVKFIFV